MDSYMSFRDALKVQVTNQCKNENKRFISNVYNVYYVSDIRSNILSLAQLLEHGYTVLWKAGCSIWGIKISVASKNRN